MSTVKKVKVKNNPFNGEKLAADFLATRHKYDLILADAAEQIGTSVSTAYRVEANKECNFKTLVAVCNWMDVQVQKYF